jgi:DNA polymerase family B, exonuclease domain
VQSHIYQLATSLNQALTLSQNRNPNDNRYNQHLAAIVLVKGVNVYGYHVGYSYFLKLYLVNPDSKWRMVELLQGGTVMGRRYQPFESHVPYLLQFMLDHNLYGMGFVDISQYTGYEVTSPENWDKGLSEYDGCMRFRCPLPGKNNQVPLHHSGKDSGN